MLACLDFSHVHVCSFDRSFVCLFASLVGWSVGQSVCLQVHLLACICFGSSLLAGWLAGFAGLLASWLADWLAGLLWLVSKSLKSY